MSYLQNYLNLITERGNIELGASISKIAAEFSNDHVRNFSFITHDIGLLFGNIQSGKTGQILGIISSAADLGFSAFLLLTTDNVALQQQTLERVKDDLNSFCVCDENDTVLFNENNLVKPTIIVLKKNSRVLRLWANVISSSSYLKGNPLFIIDDEADSASLNTLVNKNEQSTIYKYLSSIRNSALSSLYLQVTGTPQALFLQTALDGWKPNFAHYFEPGKGYLGGDFFFPTDGAAPSCIEFTDNLSQLEKSVVIRHLAVTGLILSSGGKTVNCLFHPSMKQNEHDRFALRIQSVIDSYKKNQQEFIKDFRSEFANLSKGENITKKTYNKSLAIITKLFENNVIKVLVMNGQHRIPSSEYASGCNFIVGGNTLGRGITFPSLQTICYTRISRKPQADTMWQHSRMFGYDRIPELMKVFISRDTYKIFSDINATNNALISQIKADIYNPQIYYPKDIKPTRSNVLNKQHLNLIPGGVNYYPFNPDNQTFEDITQLLKSFSEATPKHQVSLRLIRQILSHIVPSEDFNLECFLSAVDSFIAQKPSAQGYLIVRRNRNISQGTGALLSPNDRIIGDTILDSVVLTMYEVIGSGWKKKNLWIPNVKLPKGYTYYNIIET